MANRKLATSFMGLTVAFATQEATNFPKESIVDRSSPQRHWRSTSTAVDIQIVVDMLTAQTSITTYLDWCNFETVRYLEGASASGPWTTLGSDKTVQKDPMHGVYRRGDNLTLTNKRYLNITIPSGQTTTDGAPYYRIGTFCIPAGVVELDADTTVEYPYDVTLPASHIVENRFPTGKTEKIKLGQLQPMVISFALRTSVHQNIKGAQVTEIADLLRDPTQTVFIDFNLGESWQAYLVKKSGDLRASLSSPAVSTADFGSVLFDVVT